MLDTWARELLSENLFAFIKVMKNEISPLVKGGEIEKSVADDIEWVHNSLHSWAMTRSLCPFQRPAHERIARDINAYCEGLGRFVLQQIKMKRISMDHAKYFLNFADNIAAAVKGIKTLTINIKDGPTIAVAVDFGELLRRVVDDVRGRGYHLVQESI